MTANPVFVNELRQSAFRRRGTILALALVIAGTLFSILAQLDSLHGFVVYAPVVLLPLIVPAIASGAFAKEYEQQTWLDLTLTRLTNAQVVWGKFGAYFVLTAISIVAFMPSLLLMLLGEYSRRLSDLQFAIVPIHSQLAAVGSTFLFYIKLLLSASLYVLLTMVCSRYSPNRRTAITWSYIALALYTGLGMLIWNQVGSMDYQNQAAESYQAGPNQSDVPIEISMPGFMESFHLLFCGIVGAGSLLLMWVSLSEQRGYKDSADQSANTRAWQPMSRESRKPLS